jgi:two-component system, chemotaxis family, CheB/CheR fusion protein
VAVDPDVRLSVDEPVRRDGTYLQFISDATAAGIAHCSADRRFLFVNKAYAARFGLTPGQLVGRPVAEILGEEAYETIRPYVERVLTGESLQYETSISYKRAGWYYMHCAYTPEIDKQDRVAGWVAVTTDISDRYRLEQALREADRRKDEFLATLAHELRNPLAPIRNAIQILHIEGPPAPRLQWARDVIDRQVEQLTRIVDDLLDVSRITRGRIELRRERVELATIVERAVETSRPILEAAHHRLTVDYFEKSLEESFEKAFERSPEGSLWVEADLTRMGQVVSNLLNNAAKYTRPGGHVQLSAGREDGFAVIRVRDDGIGIPPEMLRRVFDLFIQMDTSLERAQGGLGIGLTIAKSLVEMHGGTIEATSEGPGRGSEITVRLPLAPDRAMPQGMPLGSGETKDGERTSAGLRILVVDDNEDSAESLALWLQLMGHDTLTAHDGPEALDAAPGYRPDLIFLDIGMPGLSGYDVARRLRERPETRDTLIVATTGWGQEEDRRRSKEAGFDHHLVKPLEPERLMGLLARISRKEG